MGGTATGAVAARKVVEEVVEVLLVLVLVLPLLVLVLLLRSFLRLADLHRRQEPAALRNHYSNLNLGLGCWLAEHWWNWLAGALAAIHGGMRAAGCEVMLHVEGDARFWLRSAPLHAALFFGAL